MVIYAQAHIGENFQKVIQSGNYEELIHTILNESTRLLPNKFKHSKVQPKGECDFVDLQTGEKYDAKLLFTPEQGKMIGSRNADYWAWIESMLDECTEFSQIFDAAQRQQAVEELILYRVFEKNLNRVQPDEHAILFSPFPIVHDSTVSFYGQFAVDILSVIYAVLLQNNLIGQRRVYVIYPSSDRRMILRNLATGVREFFPAKEFDEYIWYEM